MLVKAPDLDAYERDREMPVIRDSVLAQESTEWREGLHRFDVEGSPALSRPSSAAS